MSRLNYPMPWTARQRSQRRTPAPESPDLFPWEQEDIDEAAARLRVAERGTQLRARWFPEFPHVATAPAGTEYRRPPTLGPALTGMQQLFGRTPTPRDWTQRLQDQRAVTQAMLAKQPPEPPYPWGQPHTAQPGEIFNAPELSANLIAELRPMGVEPSPQASDAEKKAFALAIRRATTGAYAQLAKEGKHMPMVGAAMPAEYQELFRPEVTKQEMTQRKQTAKQTRQEETARRKRMVTYKAQGFSPKQANLFEMARNAPPERQEFLTNAALLGRNKAFALEIEKTRGQAQVEAARQTPEALQAGLEQSRIDAAAMLFEGFVERERRGIELTPTEIGFRDQAMETMIQPLKRPGQAPTPKGTAQPRRTSASYVDAARGRQAVPSAAGAKEMIELLNKKGIGGETQKLLVDQAYGEGAYDAEMERRRQIPAKSKKMAQDFWNTFPAVGP